MALLQCFGWSYIDDDPERLIVPANGICQVSGVLNPIATQEPILMCGGKSTPLHGYAEDGGSPWLLVNGPTDVYNRQLFNAHSMLGQIPRWVPYVWEEDDTGVYGQLDLWPHIALGEEDTDAWPKYWIAWGGAPKMVPFYEGLDPSSAMGIYWRIGKPDLQRRMICVCELAGSTIVEYDVFSL